MDRYLVAPSFQDQPAGRQPPAKPAVSVELPVNSSASKYRQERLPPLQIARYCWLQVGRCIVEHVAMSISTTREVLVACGTASPKCHAQQHQGVANFDKQ